MTEYAIEYARVWEFTTWGLTIGVALGFCWWSFGKLTGLWMRWLENIGNTG